MPDTTDEPLPPAGHAPDDAGGRDAVAIEELDLLRVQVAALRRREDETRQREALERERAEMLEAGLVGARREVLGLRQMVDDRDEEIRVLREKLDAT